MVGASSSSPPAYPPKRVTQCTDAEDQRKGEVEERHVPTSGAGEMLADPSQRSQYKAGLRVEIAQKKENPQVDDVQSKRNRRPLACNRRSAGGPSERKQDGRHCDQCSVQGDLLLLGRRRPHARVVGQQSYWHKVIRAKTKSALWVITANTSVPTRWPDCMRI